MALSVRRLVLVSPVLLLALVQACGDSDDGGAPPAETASDSGIDGALRDSAGGGRDDQTAPPFPTYTIGGNVVGLRGAGLVLANRGESLAVGPKLVDGGAPDDAGIDAADAGDGGDPVYSFTFTTPVKKDDTYSVTVKTAPRFPSQTCTVAAGTGTANANVTDVTVTCAIETFSLGGSVAGLGAGESVTLKANGGADYVINANGAFSFPDKLADLSPYDVTVVSAVGKACKVADRSGQIKGSNVTSVAVTCADCGDGVVDVGETCDDGNTNEDDACLAACTRSNLSVGGNALQLINAALTTLAEPFAAGPGGNAVGNPPENGVYITSNDGSSSPYPNFQPFLDKGAHVLMIGGSGASDFRDFVATFVGVTAEHTWHQSTSCTPDWSRGAVHGITEFLPATYEFPDQATTYHMLHFLPEASQPAGTQVLGTVCDNAHPILVTRTYPSSGTFTYLAFDAGNYGTAASSTAFLEPFLKGYLAYVRSKR